MVKPLGDPQGFHLGYPWEIHGRSPGVPEWIDACFRCLCSLGDPREIPGRPQRDSPPEILGGRQSVVPLAMYTGCSPSCSPGCPQGSGDEHKAIRGGTMANDLWSHVPSRAASVRDPRYGAEGDQESPKGPWGESWGYRTRSSLVTPGNTGAREPVVAPGIPLG